MTYCHSLQSWLMSPNLEARRTSANVNASGSNRYDGAYLLEG